MSNCISVLLSCVFTINQIFYFNASQNITSKHRPTWRIHFCIRSKFGADRFVSLA